MKENLRKIFIYFSKWNSYWNLTDRTQNLIIDPGKTGRYPLDFKPRILEEHYPFFDNNGVPMWPAKENNKYFYHYTTMFSYALGQSDFYLLTGRKEHLDKVMAVADYILKSGVLEDDGLLLRESDNKGKHTGNVSAMSQGEGMSVLCRAYEYTGNESYLISAEKLIKPFLRNVDEGGVKGEISTLKIPWYEEYVDKPLFHVLNGMVYSLWGLRDLTNLTGNKNSFELFENGIEYVEKALPLFDSGYWSYYWIPENGRNYTASMMYHNLHICQLQALYDQTGSRIIKAYIEKFLEYAKNPLKRLKAARDIFSAKISG